MLLNVGSIYINEYNITISTFMHSIHVDFSNLVAINLGVQQLYHKSVPCARVYIMDIYLITERTKFSCFIYLFLFFLPSN